MISNIDMDNIGAVLPLVSTVFRLRCRGRPRTGVLVQRKTGQLCVLRSFRRELTLVQEELAGHHGTKLRRGQGRQFLLKMLETALGAVVSFLRSRRTGSPGGPCQGQVRAEGMFFSGHAEHRNLLVHGSGERCHLGTSGNSHPEDTRGLSAGKESVVAELDLDGAGSDRSQRLLNLVDRGFRCLTDELQGYMQRLGPHPSGIGSKAAHTFREASNPLANAIVDVEGNEEAHKIATSY